MGGFGLFITDPEEITLKSGLALKETMLVSLYITRLLFSNVIKYCTSMEVLNMYWDSLTATGTYVSILVSAFIVYLCQKGSCAPKQDENG